MSNGKILFQLTGSIACYKACHVVSRLVQAGYEVEVVASRSALEFVGEATLEGLTGKPVHSETFARGGYMDHIHLIRWADLAIVCPATANTINKFAAGVGDDLISALFLAQDFKRPYLIAPAMNTMMYRHPATQSSLARLRTWGIEILEPAAGALACGEVGEGRLLEPDLILAEIERRMSSLTTASTSTNDSAAVSNATATLTSATSAASASASSASSAVSSARGSTTAAASSTTSASLFGGETTTVSSPSAVSSNSVDSAVQSRVLITSGGTREPLDGVRAITNFSTGRTGAAIADYFAAKGHAVTFLHAEGSVLPEKRNTLTLHSFATFSDLESALKAELSQKSYDAVVHLAAVGDYSVEKIEADGREINAGAGGKIDSSGHLTIRLKRNPKLVDHLREFSGNKGIHVVAFKLTNTPDANERRAAIEKLAQHAKPDWIVHNDLSAIDTASANHATTIFAGGTLTPVAQTKTKFDLAYRLEELLATARMHRSFHT